MFEFIKNWNDKYDLWSLITDFIFVFGVFVLNWNPILLIILFMLDTGIMYLFALILFHKESKNWVNTFGFALLGFVIISFLLAFHGIVMGLAEDFKMLPAESIFGDHSYVLPLIFTSSFLVHYAEFDKDINAMKDGTYKSSFIKHFFLRYIFVTGIIILISVSYVYLDSAILFGFIIIKSLLRLIKKKYRHII